MAADARILLVIVPLLSICHSQSIPMTNPVVELYGNLTEYQWTNTMVNWSCVVNVKDYSNDFDKASAQVYKQCGQDVGGVVYYPAGTYTLSSTDNLIIKSNIVIRGASTGSQKAKNGKSPGNLNPTTIFKCPDLKHQGIFNNDNSRNFGIVNINLQACAVMFWPDLKSTAKLSYQSYWFDATEALGAGRNKIVIGNKITDVSLGNPQPADQWTTDLKLPTDPWPWMFSTAIAVYSDQNMLIANNLLAKATGNRKTKFGNYSNIPYLYDNRYGIDAGQLLYGGVNGHSGANSASVCNLTLNNAPYYFQQGITVRDNYVYMNGRVGISWASGDGMDENGNCYDPNGCYHDGATTAGLGSVIYNNHVEVASGTTCYSVDGVKPCTGHDTNENRGYNQAGFGSNVTMNTGHINRQKVNPSEGPYETVDGEGVLHQCNNNCNGIRGSWADNDLSGGETGYMLYYFNQKVDDNDIKSNKVNSNQQIGAIYYKGEGEHSGNSCSDNNPKAVGC